MSTFAAYWQQLLEPGVAALPDLAAMQIWLRLGWGLVLAAVAGGVAWGVQRRLHRPPAPAVAGLLGAGVMVWCALPGAWSPAYWLGLAFQAPSLMSGVVSLAVWVRVCSAPEAWQQQATHWLEQLRCWAAAAVVLGWLLLLDTFALLPLSLYAQGFGLGAWLAVFAALGLPWVRRGGHLRAQGGAVTAVVVLLVFGLLRLPSGNVWDAVLDPWLWLFCHALVLQGIASRYKKRSA